MNAYEMRTEIRENINEETADHWSELDILHKLNKAQRLTAIKLGLATGDWLIKQSDALAPSSNQITLPSDCAKPIYMETVTSGYPISFNYTVRDRRANRQSGTSLSTGYNEGYLLQDTIEINADTFTDTVYLWYQRRVPDLMFGTAGAGGAASLTFPSAMRPKIEADYYNGVELEVVSGTGSPARDTITDYSAAFVCTVTGTYSTDSVFGTITEIPEEGIPFMLLTATLDCLARPSAALDPKYFEYFKIQQRDAKKDFEQWVENRSSGSVRTRMTSGD